MLEKVENPYSVQRNYKIDTFILTSNITLLGTLVMVFSSKCCVSHEVVIFACLLHEIGYLR